MRNGTRALLAALLAAGSSAACSGQDSYPLEGTARGGASQHASSGGLAGWGGDLAGGSSGLGASGGNASGGNASGGNASGGNASGGNASGGNASGGACTSTGVFRTQTMNPGLDCGTCHAFAVSGTLYPSLHVANYCDGDSSQSATIELTDANGTRVDLTPNNVGNFFYDSPLEFAMPYSVVVRTASGTRAMQMKPSQGNCNGCHTEAGVNGAPGRIVRP